MENNNSKKIRLYFIDNIRWLMIILVVLMHINVTYSSKGSWYYIETKELDTISDLLFGMYGSFIQAFFMGFLFLIAGYFVPGSIDKKGNRKFIMDRLIRLGIPTLIFMLILHPLTLAILDARFHFLPENHAAAYTKYITSFEFLSGSGPMWFAFALLIFSIIYTLFHILFSRVNFRTNMQDNKNISLLHIFLFAAFISIVAFLDRLVFPIGGSVMNMQIGFFTQYVVLFCVGTFAYKHETFMKLPYRTGMTWFKTAIIAGIPFWFAIMILGGADRDSKTFMGGFHWQSAAYAFWESFFCIGICAGFLVLYRDKYNRQGKIEKFLSDNAFGVYAFHAPILVLISLLWRNWQAYPVVKWLVTAMCTLPVCFGTVYLIRKVPVMKKLFS